MMCTTEAALQQEATALEAELVTLNAQIAEMGRLLVAARLRAAESKASFEQSAAELREIEKAIEEELSQRKAGSAFARESAEEVQKIEELLTAVQVQVQVQPRLMAEPEQ